MPVPFIELTFETSLLAGPLHLLAMLFGLFGLCFLGFALFLDKDPDLVLFIDPSAECGLFVDVNVRRFLSASTVALLGA